jgi:NAD(P) transhydrogenase subunit beta
MLGTIIEIIYFIGVILFIMGLRQLNSPDTARSGNLYAAVGMALGIVASMIAPMGDVPNNYAWIFGGMVVGGGFGAVASKRVQLTDMPQLVSLFNGFGGACAVLIGGVEINNYYFGTASTSMDATQLGTVLFALFVGGVAFTGSVLAWAKLDGRVNDNSLKLPVPMLINNGLLVIIVGLIAYLVAFNPANGFMLSMVIMGLSLTYGVTFVIPIGGADMPVVISLLNSFTGLTAAAAGLIYGNQIMLVGGILVGASGTILTILMCNAMNRSLWNVIFGSFGGGGAAAAKGVDGEQVVKEIGLQDLAIQLYYSKSVMMVPGYGLAVAQAQKMCKELDDLLEANGVEVRYAIHPVAGRMPGHMNVLLAEADVPYPKLLDLEEANDALPNVDVVIIVGANDVVNPAANDDPSSPIYGMPIINVTDAKHTIVMKRSMSFGYAGIQNPLFFHNKNKMLFGDAKKSLQALVSEVKDLGD